MRRAARALIAAATLLAAGLAAPPPAAGQGARQAAAPADTIYGCVVCHSDKRRSFVQGVHSEEGIRCSDCHGGDPGVFALPAAHAGRFIGTPDKLETVELCAACHSRVDLMRQYGVPADQVAELAESRHGQLLLRERNMDAPTCTDCHDAHTILRPDDARSNTHPTAIPATCGHCHEDAALIGKYGIPTTQFAEYRASAHGVALFEKENFAAPSCIGCHGSHAALPPAVTEITNVCGRCHVLVRRALNAGPHGSRAGAGGIGGCTGCHANHSTEPVPVDQIAAGCLECHEQGGRASLVGTEIQERVERATLEIAEAEDAIREIARAGRPVGDLRFRLLNARTAYRMMSEIQHSLDLERLEDLALRVTTVSRDLRGAAEASAEARWEHRLFLIPVWFLILSAVAFGSFRLRELRREAE